MAEAEGVRRRKVRAKDVFEAYFLKHHRADLLMILEAEDDMEHYPVVFNFLTFFEEHVEVAEALLASPVKLLPVLDKALIVAIRKLLEETEDKEDLSFKGNVHARITGLPTCPELYRHAVPRTCDVGRLLCVSGTVVRTTAAKMLEYQKEFICIKCKHVFTVKADHDQYYQLNKPGRCPNPNECYSNNFSLLDTTSHLLHTKDYQEIKIQEQVQKLVLGSIPRSLWVTLEDDLVGAAKPGDDVLLCGTVHRRWRPIARDTRPDIDLVFKANNVIVRNKQRSGTVVTDEMREEFADFWESYKHDPLSARNIILASFCPQVYGLYVVKMAVAVVIAGGIQKVDNSGTRVRGESHLLLVGDPGTGKSQFLKYVCSLVPRCVLTTGIGTTNAGLTVSAVRDEGEWALEAGALVLADGGVCCIDEFSNVREGDRAAIHEAMEQQTISVAKAGLVCKLTTRCSILAATNPKGQYDPEESLTVNVALASPLLSRFDLILVLLDTRNPDWDRIVSGYILEGRDPLAGDGGSEEDWSMEKLQAYFCHVRSIQPTMTSAANIILTKYYQVQRQTDQRSQARTTIRLLESLVRLSQGHARLMMRAEVTLQDAVVAVTMMEASMSGASLITGVNPLHTAFPRSPKEEYKNQAEIILQKLGLFDLLSEEMKRLSAEERAFTNQVVSSPRNLQKKRVDSNNEKLIPSSTKYTPKNTFKPSVNDGKLSSDIEELDETAAAVRQCKKQRTMNEYSKKMDESILGPDLDISFSTLMGTSNNNGKSKDIKINNKKRKAEPKSGKNGESTGIAESPNKRSRKKKDVSGNSSIETPSLVEPLLQSKGSTGRELPDDLDDFCESPVSHSVRKGKALLSKPGSGKKQKTVNSEVPLPSVKKTCTEEELQHRKPPKRKSESVSNKTHSSNKDLTHPEAPPLQLAIDKAGEYVLDELDDFYNSPNSSPVEVRNENKSLSHIQNSNMNSKLNNLNIKFHTKELQHMKSRKKLEKEDSNEDCFQHDLHLHLKSQTDLQSQIDKAGKELLEDLNDFDDDTASPLTTRNKSNFLSKFGSLKDRSKEASHNDAKLKCIEGKQVESQSSENAKLQYNEEVTEMVKRRDTENAVPEEGNDASGCETHHQSILGVSQTSVSSISSYSVSSLQRFAFVGKNNKILQYSIDKEKPQIEENKSKHNSKSPVLTSNKPDHFRENEEGSQGKQDYVSTDDGTPILDEEKYSLLLRNESAIVSENTHVSNKCHKESSVLSKHKNVESIESRRGISLESPGNPGSLSSHICATGKRKRFSFTLGNTKETCFPSVNNDNHGRDSWEKLDVSNQLLSESKSSVQSMNRSENKCYDTDVFMKGRLSGTKTSRFVLPFKKPTFLSSQGSNNSQSPTSFVGGATSFKDMDDIDFNLDL